MPKIRIRTISDLTDDLRKKIAEAYATHVFFENRHVGFDYLTYHISAFVPEISEISVWLVKEACHQAIEYNLVKDYIAIAIKEKACDTKYSNLKIKDYYANLFKKRAASKANNICATPKEEVKHKKASMPFETDFENFVFYDISAENLTRLSNEIDFYKNRISSLDYEEDINCSIESDQKTLEALKKQYQKLLELHKQNSLFSYICKKNLSATD